MIATGELSAPAIVALAALNLCLAAAVLARPTAGRDWTLRAARLAWFSSAVLAVNLLDCWAYAALLPDVHGMELAVAPEVIALAPGWPVARRKILP